MRSQFFLVGLIALAVIAGAIFMFDQSVPVPIAPALAEAALPPPIAKSRAQLSPPELAARAYLIAVVMPDGRQEILLEKNARLRWPIASITKLFTASVVLDNHPLEQVLTLTNADLPEVNDSGYFHSGESFTISNMLLPLLINSSNNAATALARLSLVSDQDFITQLNQFASKLNLHDTRLFNPSGLDPILPSGVNYSSPRDLLTLAQWLLAFRPEILTLTYLPQANVYRADGSFHHQARSTNELLLSRPEWAVEIVGGKTGQTDLAGKNLLLILHSPATGGHVVSVILGSPDHFLETRTLIDWARQAYQL